MQNKIKQLSESVFDYVCNVYKHLHAHPELAFSEKETSAFIQKELEKMNIPFRANIAQTGVLGILKGKNPEKKIIALRADMDALPVCEEVEIPHKSKNPHVMHACGHDAHVASLLGAAKILSALKDEFEGTILFIFQPGEERHPGGARVMLQEGVFDQYKPELILAAHVSIDYPVGTVAFRSGEIMASADEIHLTIKGKGGHGALPLAFNDTVLASAQTVVALQQVSARLCSPFSPMVLSFGKFNAPGETNVIPNEVKLSGTLRCFDEAWRAQAKKHIERIATHTAVAYGCTCDVVCEDGYPVVKNDKTVTENAIRFAKEFVGETNVGELEVRMTGEDFGFFTQQYPCSFYRFGVKGEVNQQTGNLHSATFHIDLEAFRTSVGVMAWLAWRNLKG